MIDQSVRLEPGCPPAGRELVLLIVQKTVPFVQLVRPGLASPAGRVFAPLIVQKTVPFVQLVHPGLESSAGREFALLIVRKIESFVRPGRFERAAPVEPVSEL